MVAPGPVFCCIISCLIHSRFEFWHFCVGFNLSHLSCCVRTWRTLFAVFYGLWLCVLKIVLNTTENEYVGRRACLDLQGAGQCIHFSFWNRKYFDKNRTYDKFQISTLLNNHLILCIYLYTKSSELLCFYILWF